jgi:hypothetical protein
MDRAMLDKDELLNNRFVFVLRDEGRVDDRELDLLLDGIRTLSVDWQSRSDVDKELAGWLMNTVLSLAGAHERFVRNGADDLGLRVSAILGELYALVEECFSSPAE